MIFPLRDENRSGVIPWVTYGLVVANAAAMFWLFRLPPDEHVRMLYRYGFVPARLAQLDGGKPIVIKPNRMENLRRQMQGQGLQVPQQLNPIPSEIIFSLLTCMFLHGSIPHILGNMWFLWIFGDNIEHRLGHLGFIFFYLGGGVAATLCHWATGPNSLVPVIGASGAVAAVLGAYAVAYPWARVKCLIVLVIFITFIDLPALAVLGLWFGGQLLSAYRVIGVDLDGGVAFWAHVGGFSVGAIVMALYDTIARPDQPDPWREFIEQTYGHER